MLLSIEVRRELYTDDPRAEFNTAVGVFCPNDAADPPPVLFDLLIYVKYMTSNSIKVFLNSTCTQHAPNVQQKQHRSHLSWSKKERR